MVLCAAGQLYVVCAGGGLGGRRLGVRASLLCSGGLGGASMRPLGWTIWLSSWGWGVWVHGLCLQRGGVHALYVGGMRDMLMVVAWWLQSPFEALLLMLLRVCCAAHLAAVGDHQQLGCV